jgi:hypothetical protein
VSSHRRLGRSGFLGNTDIYEATGQIRVSLDADRPDVAA